MKVRKNEYYLLHWTHNPVFWNEGLEKVKKLYKENYNKFNGCINPIFKHNRRYYTLVAPHFSGNFSTVDCTCDLVTGDFHPVNTSLLKELPF